MTVQYDHQIFCEQRFGGISRYFFELIKAYRKTEGIVPKLEVYLSNNIYAKQLAFSSNTILSFPFKGKKDLSRVINFYNTKQTLLKKNYNIYHPTYYNAKLLKYNGNKPLVITIHDLIDEKFNANNTNFKKIIASRKACIERADTIITISHSTKKDLLNFYNVNEGKVQVVYHGNSLSGIDNANTIRTTEQSYLLYIGSRKGSHKNFETFISAVAIFLRKEKTFVLVCGGGGNFTVAELALFKQLGIDKKVFFKEIVNDESLVALYKNAALFIYPSLYEGFGFPILEAFSCSCPVLTSNISSMPEIAGAAAFYCDTKNKEAITNSIETIINNKTLQQSMIENGQVQAAKFTWQKAIEATKEIYKQLL